MTSSSALQQVLESFGKKEIVKIKDLENVERILSKILEGGQKSLQIIADFDKTITRFHKDGLLCDSSYRIIDHSPRMPESFKAATKALSNKYHPIEVDPVMSVEEKIPHMINFYKEEMIAIAECHIDKDLLKLMVKESRAILRDNAKKLLETLNEVEIPILIFSAGIGDTIQEVLVQHEAFFPNMKIIANFMNYDEQGRLTNFKDPIIHTFNKNESILDHSTYFYDLAHRGNVLLMGDSDGDAQMANGMQSPGAILKIGFLNTNIEERMEYFMGKFDIVLVDDQSMDFVNLLLDQILKEKQA